MRDPASIHMAAFTAADPNDRIAFDAHMASITTAPDVTHRVITRDDQLVGTVACFVVDGVSEVTYWIDRSYWGQGIATAALELLLDEVTVRPLQARAASDNAGSLRVLHKVGFRPVGNEVSYATGRRAQIVETILELS